VIGCSKKRGSKREVDAKLALVKAEKDLKESQSFVAQNEAYLKRFPQ